METFFVNETEEDVWYDNFRVLSSTALVVQENHYDPWGMVLKGLDYQYGGIKENKYLYNGKEKLEDLGVNVYDYGARFYDPAIGRWTSPDPMASEREWVSPYNFVQNNPLNRIDPDGAFDWVINKDNEIYWDDNATSQATTKKGETYLGQNLTFTFNSYISDSYDGPPAPWEVTGDKLTSTITLNSTKNSDGSLKSVSVSSSDPEIGKTGGYSIFKGRDYFPGLGSDQNKSINVTGTPNFSATYEQHASVPGLEAFMLNAIGYDAVNVAQRLNLSLSGNQLSIKAATDVFPSATLNVNGKQLFQYNQPSFKGTHGRDSRMYGEHMIITTPRRPLPQFYNRYNK